MHYEDLRIVEIKKTEDFWFAKLVGNKGGVFLFPIADANVSEEEITNNGIYEGKNLLGAVQNNSLIGIDSFSFIKSNVKRR